MPCIAQMRKEHYKRYHKPPALNGLGNIKYILGEDKIYLRVIYIELIVEGGGILWMPYFIEGLEGKKTFITLGEDKIKMRTINV